MKARIKILTQTLGRKSLFEGEGELDRIGDGFRMCYLIEGDEASLDLFADRIIMRRSGMSELFAEFSEEQKFSLRITLGGERTEIPLVTRVLRCRFGERELNARLVYDLAFTELQRFYLQIFIKISEE